MFQYRSLSHSNYFKIVRIYINLYQGPQHKIQRKAYNEKNNSRAPDGVNAFPKALKGRPSRN